MKTIAILVAKFPRKVYNIRQILGQKLRYPNKIIVFGGTDIAPRGKNLLTYYNLTFNVKNHLNISEKDQFLKSFYSYHMILIIFQIQACSNHFKT